MFRVMWEIFIGRYTSNEHVSYLVIPYEKFVPKIEFFLSRIIEYCNDTADTFKNWSDRTNT